MNCIVTRNPSLYIFSIILFLMGDNVQKKWKQGNVIHRKLLMCLFARRKKEFRNTHLCGVDSGLISLSGNTKKARIQYSSRSTCIHNFIDNSFVRYNLIYFPAPLLFRFLTSELKTICGNKHVSSQSFFMRIK